MDIDLQNLFMTLNQNIDKISGVIIPKKTINELSKLLSDIDQDIVDID